MTVVKIKMQKAQNLCHKQNLNFKNYNCLQQLNLKTKQIIQKKGINIDSLKKMIMNS